MIARIVNRHVGREMYDAINANVDIEHRHPLGLILHGAALVDGTMRVAQVWESEEYAELYDEETLKPALRSVGAPLDAEVTILELYQLVTP